MRSYFQFVTSRPIPVLVFFGIVGAVFGAMIPRLTRETSPDAFIPSDHWALTLKREVDEMFGLKEPIAIGVIRDGPGGVFNPDTLKLIQNLTRAIQGLPGVEPDDVLSITTEAGVYFEDGEPGFDPLLKSIPDDPESLGALRSDILGYELYRGTLIAADGSGATILVRTQSEQQADDLYRRISVLLADPDITGRIVAGERLVVAGEAAVRAHMGVAVSDDALRMNFICPIIIF